jgi:formate dehydrogenase subunit gamma
MTTATDGGKWDEAVARQVVAREKDRPGALLPVLHAVQTEFGWVPPQAVAVVADLLNLSRAEVHGVLTFYHDFRTAPPRRHVLKLCAAESCQAMGGDDLGAAVGDHPALTVETAYCLGLCALSPAALLDGRPHGRLDPARLTALLAPIMAETA